MPAGAWITIVVLAGSLTIALALLRITARVAAPASGGEILVTQPVADDLAAHGRFRLSGGEPAELPGVPGEHTLWRVGRRRG